MKSSTKASATSGTGTAAGPRREALGDLKQALALDPAFSVLIAHGLTDQVTPYFASKLLIDQIPPMGDAARQLKVYGGGHMLYLKDVPRRVARGRAQADRRKLIILRRRWTR